LKFFCYILRKRVSLATYVSNQFLITGLCGTNCKEHLGSMLDNPCK
jgi:hypothetical protein